MGEPIPTLGQLAVTGEGPADAAGRLRPEVAAEMLTSATQAATCGCAAVR